MFLIWGALGVYSFFPFAEFTYSDSKGFHIGGDFSVVVLFYLALLYSVLVVPALILKRKSGNETKFLQLLDAVQKGEYSIVVKKNMLFFLVKFFFIPLMVPSTIIYFKITLEMLNHPIQYQGFIHYFNTYVYSVIVHLVMFVALAIYSFGYLIESEKLDSRVKSVDSTWFGWGVTVICYVPFFIVVSRYIPFYTHDFSYFINSEITFVIRLLLVGIMMFKIWSISTLGVRCSNLTNRGIVQSGPYRWVRHPHYLSKLLVWWGNFVPLFLDNYWMIGGMIFWTTIYILRALTEEKHLSQDLAYQDYMQQVKWRFIPFVF